MQNFNIVVIVVETVQKKLFSIFVHIGIISRMLYSNVTNTKSINVHETYNTENL